LGARIIVVTVILCFAMPGWAASDRWNIVGVRGGVGDSRNAESFSQVEAYALWSLPWRWQSESGWVFGSFIGLNAGALLYDEDAFIGAIGPGGYIMTPSRRFVFSAGSSPTFISRSDFGKEDLGGHFQFTTAVCINVNFLENVTAGYCFQHMSNAGIYDNNPGIDMHMFGLGYRF
jgi:hypothetical protein